LRVVLEYGVRVGVCFSENVMFFETDEMADYSNYVTGYVILTRQYLTFKGFVLLIQPIFLQQI